MASYDYAELYTRLESLTEAFSHGLPGFQVFRLEQTEIGQRLITASGDGDAACMSFSEFVDRCEQQDQPRWLSSLRRHAKDLLDHPAKELVRTARIDDALMKLLVLLDPQRRWRPRIDVPAIDVSSIVEQWRERDLIEAEQAEGLLAQAAAAGLMPRSHVSALTDRDADVR
jgi:hypothetical protein